MNNDTTPDARTARTERIVLVIGMLITYGVTLFWSRFYVLALTAAVCGADVAGNAISAPFAISEAGLVARNRVDGADIHWVDNDRVLLIAGKSGDVAIPEPDVKEQRFHLLLWTPKASRVAVVHNADIANGSLCFSAGYLRLAYTSDYRRAPIDQRWQVLEGPLGKETLRQLDRSALEDLRNHVVVVNPYTCREYQRQTLPKLGVRTTPLLDGDFISQEREPRPAETVHWKYWPRGGSAVSLDMTPEVVGVARYSRYADAYVLIEQPHNTQFGDRVVRRSWLLRRAGEIRPFTPPSGPWMRGSTAVMPTKAGLFLTSHAVETTGNGAAGAYLQAGDALVRVIAGVPTSFDVSPDGCRVALSIYDFSPRQSATPRVKAFDVCTKGR